jgi:hypothetical protein
MYVGGIYRILEKIISRDSTDLERTRREAVDLIRLIQETEGGLS